MLCTPVQIDIVCIGEVTLVVGLFRVLHNSMFPSKKELLPTALLCHIVEQNKRVPKAIYFLLAQLVEIFIFFQVGIGQPVVKKLSDQNRLDCNLLGHFFDLKNI